MRIKEAKTCCAFAWSPLSSAPGIIATGSIAGAMGDDFTCDANLELLQVDMSDPSSTSMPVMGRAAIMDRVHRIDWGNVGGSHGTIATAFVDGSVHLWSVDSIIEAGAAGVEDAESAVLGKITHHTGAVKGCQFNPLSSASNFLATGGVDKKLCVWDIRDAAEPTAVPVCANSTHATEITDLRWNVKFPNILGTTTSGGVVTVWDLKTKRAAVSFQVQANNPTSANTLAWHPDIATHVAVARDDPSPVIQIWDLKKAMAPIRELQGHTGGILGLSWCADDPSILVSCGRDGRTICWNPLTGEELGEMDRQENWVYDVQWSPRFPAVIASASFDSSLGVFSAQDVSTQSGSSQRTTAPKWLRRPCGAVFGYGGRIAVAVPGASTIKIAEQPASDLTATEKRFRAAVAAHPPGTQERANWCKDEGWTMLAATAESGLVGNKMPLLNLLGFSADSDATKNASGSDDDFEKSLARCICGGRIGAAVDLCLAADRLDDAFATAMLSGLEDLNKVRAHYLARRAAQHRYAKYLEAIMNQKYDQLTSLVEIDGAWEEVLALLCTYLGPESFASQCQALGLALAERGCVDEAAKCFICSGNVDRLAELWLRDKSLSKAAIVHQITVIEESTGHRCTLQAFGDLLADYADSLAGNGELAAALSYAARAAEVGSTAGALIANRAKYIVGKDVKCPFVVTPLPDATTPECQIMASAMAAKPRPAAESNSRAASPQSSQFAAQPQQHFAGANQQGYPQQPQQQQQYAPQPQHQQPVQPAPTHTSPQPQQYHLQYAQNFPQQHAPQHQQQQQYQPPQQQYPTAPQQPQPQYHAPAAQPQYQQPAAPPQPQYHAPPQPQPQPQPQPPQHQYQPPVQQYQPPTQPPVAPVAPPTVSAPARQTSPAPLPPGPPQTAPGGAPSGVNLQGLSPAQSQVAEALAAALSRVNDPRKRDQIEKSFGELVNRMRGNQVSDTLLVGLREFSANIGSAESKEAWRKIADAHFNEVQPFIHIKFLN